LEAHSCCLLKNQERYSSVGVFPWASYSSKWLFPPAFRPGFTKTLTKKWSLCFFGEWHDSNTNQSAIQLARVTPSVPAPWYVRTGRLEATSYDLHFNGRGHARNDAGYFFLIPARRIVSIEIFSILYSLLLEHNHIQSNDTMSCVVESASAGYWLLGWSGVILTSALIIATGLSGTPLDQLGTFLRFE
jgi:hypothetical protein